MLIQTDALTGLKNLPAKSIHTVITSPPYWGPRSYLDVNDEQKSLELGTEATPELYVERLAEICAEIYRVLRDDGVFWLNLGDSYISARGRYNSSPQTIRGKHRGEPIQHDKIDLRALGYQDKDLAGIPWLVVFTLKKQGWILRRDLPWIKKAGLPESTEDRFTSSHEYVFHFVKSSRYYFSKYATLLPHRTKPQRRLTPRDQHPKGDVGRGSHMQPAYASTQVNIPMVPGSPEGRHYRSSDFWRDAIEDEIQDLKTRAAHLQKLLDTEGVLAEVDENTFESLYFGTLPFPENHFAVFPAKLIEPLLLSSCPHQVCVVCGSPYRDHYDSYSDSANNPRDYQGVPLHQPNRNHTQEPKKTGAVGTSTYTYKGTLPTCSCEAAVEAGIVLDPFAGAGTTLLVAKQHKRRYLGFELDMKSCDLAQRRLDSGITTDDKFRLAQGNMTGLF